MSPPLTTKLLVLPLNLYLRVYIYKSSRLENTEILMKVNYSKRFAAARRPLPPPPLHLPLRLHPPRPQPPHLHRSRRAATRCRRVRARTWARSVTPRRRRRARWWTRPRRRRTARSACGYFTGARGGALRVRRLLRHTAALRPAASGARRPARIRWARALHLYRCMHRLFLLLLLLFVYDTCHIW